MLKPLLDYLYTGRQDAILDRIFIKSDESDVNDLKNAEESLLGLWKNVQSPVRLQSVCLPLMDIQVVKVYFQEIGTKARANPHARL